MCTHDISANLNLRKAGLLAMRWTLAVAACTLLAGCTATPIADDVAPAGRIDGAVIDPWLQPFGGLNVSIVELGRIDTTSAMGGFTFRNVPPGLYTLLAAPLDSDEDRRTIRVTASEVVRVILQPVPHEVPFARSAEFTHRGASDLLLPGAECIGCSWTTRLHDQATALDAWIHWDAVRPEEDRLRIEVRDNHDALVAVTEGVSPLRVHTTNLPPAGSGLTFHVQATPDWIPQALDLDTLIRIHYETISVQHH